MRHPLDAAGEVDLHGDRDHPTLDVVADRAL
jgi:hypothetical protein